MMRRARRADIVRQILRGLPLICGGLVLAVSAGQAQTTPGVPRMPFPLGQDVALPRSPLLTIDRDALFVGSAYGQRLQAELRADSIALAEENRALTADLSEEEQRLTEQRATLPVEEFRTLADAFDAKVTRLRSEQDAKTRALQRRQETERQQFFANALPVLSRIVQEAGAVAILDRGTVFLTADEIDITDLAIARLDAAIGDGRGLPSGDGSGAETGVSPRQRPDLAVPEGSTEP